MVFPHEMFQGFLGLGHFQIRHAPGCVENQHQVTRDAGRLHLFNLRRDQQHEVAILTRHWAIHQGCQADVLLAEAVKELEILIENSLVFLELDDNFVIAFSFHVDGVCWAVDRLNRVL